MQTGKHVGMQTLNEALIRLVRKGVISSREGKRKSVNKQEFTQLLEKASGKAKP